MELLREAHGVRPGVRPCDARRPRSVAAARFPSFDFSAVETEDDTWHQPSVRERVQELPRAAAASDWTPCCARCRRVREPLPWRLPNM